MIDQDAGRLRRDLATLWERRAKGDLPERTFQKESEQLGLNLCRAIARQSLGEDEQVRVEHHVVRAHTRLAGSVLRESEQEFISLLATDHRLFRLRAILTPDQPLLFLKGAGDALDELPYASVTGVEVRTQRRKGEIIAGLVIAGFAVLGRSYLQVTSVAMFLLGVAGCLHGFLLPTRWAEVVERVPSASPPFQIWALRKKSARTLLRFLRRRIPQSG